MSTDATREATESARTEPERPGETLAQRADRNVMELLNELRVVGIGVQVLFGFLLSIPFAKGFPRLDHFERGIWLASLVFAALATALLVAPVAYHRWLFRRHEKETLVRVTNRLAIGGLIAVGLAVCSAVLLVTSFVAPGVRSIVITAGLVCVFAGLWFVMPLSRVSQDDIDDRDDRDPGR